MKVSIIILSKNGQECIQKCLDKVCNQNYDHDYEVVVIDSGSTDKTLEIIKKYPLRLYEISSDDFRHSKTRNLGASFAKGEFVVFLSQDAEPLDENWLYHLTLPLLKDVWVGAVFGRQIPTKESNPVNRFRVQWIYGEDSFTKSRDSGFEFPRALFSFSNVNSATRKDLLSRFPFREDLFFCEDVSLAKQLITNGYTIVYSSEAPVFHSHNFGIGEAFSRYFDVAVAYKKIGILEETKKIEKEGNKYVLEELRYLIKNSHSLWIFYSLINNLIKYMGFKIGCAEQLVPLLLKKKISKYWYRDA